MANLILHLTTQFGKSLIVSVRLENGIVAEAPHPTPLAGNLSLNDAFEAVNLLNPCAATRTYIPFLY